MLLRFNSTNGQSPSVDLREAFLRGQAPDKGLYLPEQFPLLSQSELAEFSKLTYAEIAFRVLSRYLDGLVPLSDLETICSEVYDFDIPLEKVYDRVHVMRLDRGPTASFKDFAARMMGRLMGRFLKENGGKLIILTATSGDTGSAVAHAFHKVPGVEVVVLFPYAEVSPRQRKLMTTLRDNVHTVAMDGKFDDCQAMVKRAFADADLRHLPLSSANSINIGRLLPQSVYYFYAASRLARPAERIVFSIPSGNFGDMMGSVVAKQMGLPVRKIIASVNENDAFPRFLASGVYEKVSPSRNSVSNAMNVGHPSNLARLVAIYGGQMDETGRIVHMPDLEQMRADLYSNSVSDAVTRKTVLEVWEKFHVLLEPHGAVAWHGFMEWQKREPLNGLPAVILETAHPAKFPEEIEKTLGFSPDVPSSIEAAEKLPEHFEHMNADYGVFKDYLINGR